MANSRTYLFVMKMVIILSFLFMRLEAARNNIAINNDHHHHRGDVEVLEMKMMMMRSSSSSSDLRSEQMLRKLGFDVSKLVAAGKRRSVMVDRVAPGGPDPQHHA
ncbi:CLAVATA3/ESR (CLE)-related protein 7-like [Cannabis sativa]|uniref:CLAVATA3/ESR (CLE)-related protein 7-like n=1 Tax=Cannabis sativa TaxID=3483 RepID=UPI0029CA3E50|nr:CLAVATA3/ESR (CLE)-related protein 7-like [Cannabis sativa]